MNDFSFVANAHPNYIDSLYAQYQQDPSTVDEGWQNFFKGFDYADSSANSNGQSNGASATATAGVTPNFDKEIKVLSLIKAFRNRGHLLSDTNPIRTRRDRHAALNIEDFGLEQSDLNTVFQSGREADLKNATLQQIIDHMHKIYCGHIGFEYHHIEDRKKRRWIRTKIEQHHPEQNYNISLEKKKRILEKLNGAVIFEEFLHTKYIGQKRFSLEGGESTIVALDAIINHAAEDRVEEIIIGMAHRGRLNVLVNILGKTYEQIFNEFEGKAVPDSSLGDGDVKYHLGYSSMVTTTNDKKVHLKLVPNPSHLESVDPVVEGFARAKADILYDSDYDRILPILLHGDAALAGQGIVFETVQMSQLDGYYTGGTIHIAINNQVGFTTNWDEARSSTYCTGVANVVQAPVFHVNGDDPEAVLFAVEFAIEYRQKFNNDVFIDLVCYRKHGHNEGDDPKFTQPELYELIDEHKDPRQIYSEILASRGDLQLEIAEQMETSFWSTLQDRLEDVKEHPLPYQYQEPEQAWRDLKKDAGDPDFSQSPATGIDRKQVDEIINHLMTIPKGFKPLKKVNRLLKGKQKLLDNNNLDWAMGELLAYSSILLENKDVRMTGQDVRRGTFSHRHAVFYDRETFEAYNRLNTIEKEQGKYRIFNSLLSEFGVLGFEYGYSLATPHALVVWEAQFGDFYNGAQTIVDQFITAAESKWNRMSGLVMLLPHGYEGQGPEHSSARVERFLQQCANNNITVANVTNPANFFHLLRRQLARPFRKPLVVMSPKSLLRHPLCVSNLEDFTGESRFLELIDDPQVTTKTAANKVKTVLLCTGKIYYDLLEKQKADKRKDVAIVRLEQLYPLPSEQLEAIFKKYEKADLRWVQEESANMGAWRYIQGRFTDMDKRIAGISRAASASPATGFKTVHVRQQNELIDLAFATESKVLGEKK